MKKTIAVLSALVSAAAFAVGNDLLVSFSTPGPDKYADGTEVQAGECYSLVYTKADGSQEVVVNYQTRYAGKCSPVVFVVEESAAAKYKGGTWGVYVLDTRDFANDGKPAGLDNEGNLKVVNVKAPVVATIDSSASFANADTDATVSAGAYDLAGANVPQPRVTGIKVVGANVVVTVADTRPFVGYTLVSGSDACSFSAPGGTGVSGDLSNEIEIITPKAEGAQFFKVSTVK